MLSASKKGGGVMTKKSGLQATLIRNTVIVVVLSLFIATAWFAMGSWMSGYFGGMAWTQQGLQGFVEAVAMDRERRRLGGPRLPMLNESEELLEEGRLNKVEGPASPSLLGHIKEVTESG